MNQSIDFDEMLFSQASLAELLKVRSALPIVSIINISRVNWLAAILFSSKAKEQTEKDGQCEWVGDRQNDWVSEGAAKMKLVVWNEFRKSEKKAERKPLNVCSHIKSRLSINFQFNLFFWFSSWSRVLSWLNLSI